jgi:hypothetical protein
MYKHRATITDRRLKILFLIAKGYKNKQIAKKLKMTLSNTTYQKWRLYCFLGDVHSAIDAVYMGLQRGFLRLEDLSEAIREEIYDNENEKQMYSSAPTRKRNNRNIPTDTKVIPFPAKRVRAI